MHQEAEPEANTDPWYHQRTAIQVAELKFSDGKLNVDRDEIVTTPFLPPN